MDKEKEFVDNFFKELAAKGILFDDALKIAKAVFDKLKKMQMQKDKPDFYDSDKIETYDDEIGQIDTNNVCEKWELIKKTINQKKLNFKKK